MRGRPPGTGFWTRERIIDAIQEWTNQHGRTPRMQEWRVPGRAPWAATVTGVFGSWSAALEAAGYGRVPRGRRRDDW